MRKLPRVMAVHDLSCYSKCSLMIAIPVISACGAEICPLPASILSSNFSFSEVCVFDLTEEMRSIISKWQKIGVSFDAMFTGFLGSCAQIEVVEAALEAFAPSLAVIDPVMGDGGKLYRTITPEICDGMKRLVRKADVLLPNITEACVLTGREYSETMPEDEIRAVMEELMEMGAKSVVLKGIKRNRRIVNCIIGDDGYYEVESDLLPFSMFGTGDLFASVVTGKLLAGENLHDCVQAAADFTRMVMSESRKFEDHERRGLCFEPFLGVLSKNTDIER